MKKVLLTAFLTLYGFTANASCPNANVINQEVASATSYNTFDTAMNQYGGLIQLTSSGNFAKSNWTKFQVAIASTPFTQVQTASACLYHSSGNMGYISLKLGNPAP